MISNFCEDIASGLQRLHRHLSLPENNFQKLALWIVKIEGKNNGGAQNPILKKDQVHNEFYQLGQILAQRLHVLKKKILPGQVSGHKLPHNLPCKIFF